jgi:putative DNA primase/helicase
MVALVEHAKHGPVAIHRTYLQAAGRGKAGIDPDRATLGPVGGGAVRLAPIVPNEWLIVGEGIETTLSAMQASHLPGWAALSAGGLGKLVLPPVATHVIIAADNDEHGRGQRAAREAAERFMSEGRQVRVATPPGAGDFNDVLTERLKVHE